MAEMAEGDNSLGEGTAARSTAQQEPGLASPRVGLRLPIGAVLAQRYRIVRFLAQGGMGEVYEAEDLELYESVALKAVAAAYAGCDDAIAALKAEVQLARRIGHRHVCRIYDIGMHQEQEGPAVVFLTMELVHGETLAELLAREGRFELRTVYEFAKGISSGLSAAHEAGVLHRDLKSDNVMLRREPKGGISPVVMDFGLASALNPNSSRISSDQALVGSLAYMAPEQVQGEPLRVATDIYALGIIIFEMVTGRRPFLGATPAVCALKRLQEPAPRLRTLLPGLPAELDDLVARCLEREPKDRFQSAHAVQAALVRLPDAEPVQERTLPSSSPERTLMGSAVELKAAHTLGRSPEAEREPGAPSHALRRIATGIALALLVAGALQFLVSMRSPSHRVVGELHRTQASLTSASPPGIAATVTRHGMAADATEKAQLIPLSDLAGQAEQPGHPIPVEAESPSVPSLTSGVAERRGQRGTARDLKPASARGSAVSRTRGHTVDQVGGHNVSEAKSDPNAVVSESSRCPPGILCPSWMIEKQP